MTRSCGRPTLNGTPCRRPLLWYEDACTVHATSAELDDATARLRHAARPCPCPCHQTIQPGLITCPRCAP